jgi:hypothetical protein
MTSRRSIMLGLVLGAFLGVFGFNSVYAQVPRSISYQGLLVKNNQPVTAQVNIDVVIYDAAGTTLYKETESGVNVTNGIFNILLGGNSGTLPASLKFDEQYYLGVDVDGTGEVTPRTPFVASPYALNSQTVGGVGVSVTPQPGMLLPLDQNGKLPKSVLPLSTQASLVSIDKLTGDATGNVTLQPGGPNVHIIDNSSTNTITIGVDAASGGIQTVVAGPGLTGGGSTPSVTLQINQNGITNGMLGNGVVTGRNLDQNIPQFGLYQDQFGQLNVGVDPSFTYYQFGSSTSSPAQPLRNIGLNLNHTNNWLAVQNFLGGLTGSFGTLTTATIGVLGTNAQALTVNGLAEPLAGPNAAAFYEIQDNGDLRVTGTAYIVGNTYIGANTNGGTNTMGTSNQSTNTVQGITNNITAANSIGASSNNLTAGTSNNIQSPANNIGTANAGSANTIGNAGSSTNVVTGATNTLTATTSNGIQAPTNNIGTANVASANTIGNAGSSTNVVTGATNTVTGTTSNGIQSPANSIGTTQAAGNTNTIGTAGNSVNLITGQTNSTIGTSTNNSQAPTVNIGTTQVAGGVVNVGTAGVTANTITGTNNTVTGTGTNSIQSPTNNIGTSQIAGGSNNIGTSGISTNNVNGLNSFNTETVSISSQAPTINIGTAPSNTNINIGINPNSSNSINGTTTFNGNVFHNGNITQNSGTTSLLATTVTGTFTQSGGNATINGGGTNVFGSVAGSSNTIGGAGSTNTITGGTNNMTATTADNISAPTITLTGNVTSTGGTFTSTGNSTIGSSSTANTIGAAGASTNLIQGTSTTITSTGANNFNAGTANNFTGDIIQASGRVSIAPSAGTTNNFGFGAAGQINNFGTGASATNSLGSGNGSVNNIGVTTGGGISTNNVGNLNAGTNNNVNGTTTFQGATLTGADGNQIVRITGGPQSCAGALPTALTSQLFADGDAWFGGTVSTCRLNVTGVAPTCISALNTTTFGACAGGATQISLISGFNGNAIPNGNPINFTNIDNIQANTQIKSNIQFTVGNGANATAITPGTTPTTGIAPAVPGAVNLTTPIVSGRIPTFQTYTATLVANSGPNGGGSINFWNTTGAAPVGPTANFAALNFDANSNITVTYRTHNLGIPAGALYVTTTGTTTINVESSAANDNNSVQISILRP